MNLHMKIFLSHRSSKINLKIKLKKNTKQTTVTPNKIHHCLSAKTKTYSLHIPKALNSLTTFKPPKKCLEKFKYRKTNNIQIWHPNHP